MSRVWVPEVVFTPTADPTWRLSQVGYDPLRESSQASRFAVSNGFLGIRGERSFTRGRRGAFPNAAYVAGLFDRTGEAGGVPVLLPIADWLQVHLQIDGVGFVEDPADAPSHRMELDMRRGMVLSDCIHVVGGLRARTRTLRLVSLRDRAIGLQLIRMDMLDGAQEVFLEASLDGAHHGLVHRVTEPGLTLWRTRRSGIEIAITTAPTLKIDGWTSAPRTIGPLRSVWAWKTQPGQVVEFQRIVSVARAGDDAAAAAHSALSRAVRRGPAGLVADHETAWSERWACSAIEIDGDPAAQRALRFAAYHLNSAANPSDAHVSIGARGLTGSDYGGHVFWDTEIFLLPFYCAVWPEAARALLMYRFHTLEAARRKAARLGWRGALYAWESADTGDEAAPPFSIAPDRQVLGILTGTREQHISADVAYGVWRYWIATGDEGFLREAGAEILLETARFWVSRAVPEPDGRRHIRNVIGPDEYHEGIDDNAFTNLMARWNIYRGIEAASLLQSRWPRRWTELSDQLELEAGEIDQWRIAAETIETGFDPGAGLYEQFAGFFDLEPIDLSRYAGRSVPMDIVLGRERTRRSQVIKQADVLALLALLPDAFVEDAGKRNFSYYEPRCGHGSSLSTALHGLVAARLGETDKALDYFHRTAAIDLADATAAIGGGVHIGALGGLWMTAIHGFAGVAYGEAAISFAPRLPPGWTRMAFRLQWRGRQVRCEIEQTNRLTLVLERGASMTARVEERDLTLDPGCPLEVLLDGLSAVKNAS